MTGRRRRVARDVHGAREDAEVALARLRVADHERRLPTGGTNARSVRAAFQLYQQTIDAGLIELEPSTIATVRSVSRVLSAVELADGRTFGDIRLSRLTWEDIEHLYAADPRSGERARRTSGAARPSSPARSTWRATRGPIDSNPSKDATRPRQSRSKPFAPTTKDVSALLTKMERRAPDMADVGTILASTGMRRGELLALLRWSDVDLDAAEIHVAAAISDGGPGIGVVRKKTKRSDWRDVPLTAAAVQAFRRQAKRRESPIGSEPKLDEYVFPQAFDGRTPMRPDLLSLQWATARRTSPITLLHLRHFTATAMLDAGESYRTVADILGNSEATLRLHYDGRTDTGKRRAIAVLEL